MNVQLAARSIFDGDAEDFRFEPGASADFAWHPRHERANPVSSEFAFGLVVKPLHLRDQSFERSFFLVTGPGFIGVTAEIHFDRRSICSEIEGLLEFFR